MKVYFDKKLIKKEYVSFLAPLLGLPDFDIWREDKDQIKEWTDYGKNFLSLSSEKECDYFVYPKYFKLEFSNELKTYSKKAKHHNKKVLVFYYWEIDDYIDISDNILWYKRSTKNINPDNEYCLPPFPQDLFAKVGNNIAFVDKQSKKPYSIWYTWYSNYFDLKSFIRYMFVRFVWIVCRTKLLKNILMLLKKEDLYATLVNAWYWNSCRSKTIKQLQKLKKYKFDFTQRAHALTIDAKVSMREEYIKNLVEIDFPLLVRGFWNYSVRQYEVLSLGKIPLYIDTDAKLPFEDEIPYKDLFIIVPFGDVKNIKKYIDHYIDKNQNKLVEIQKEIRNIYQEYFVMKNYYVRIINSLEKK